MSLKFLITIAFLFMSAVSCEDYGFSNAKQATPAPTPTTPALKLDLAFIDIHNNLKGAGLSNTTDTDAFIDCSSTALASNWFKLATKIRVAFGWSYNQCFSYCTYKITCVPGSTIDFTTWYGNTGQAAPGQKPSDLASAFMGQKNQQEVCPTSGVYEGPLPHNDYEFYRYNKINITSGTDTDTEYIECSDV